MNVARGGEVENAVVTNFHGAGGGSSRATACGDAGGSAGGGGGGSGIVTVIVNRLNHNLSRDSHACHIR